MRELHDEAVVHDQRPGDALLAQALAKHLLDLQAGGRRDHAVRPGAVESAGAADCLGYEAETWEVPWWVRGGEEEEA